MWVLCLNSLVYWLTFFHFWKKDGFIPSTSLWLYYAFFSIFGVVLVSDDLYSTVMEKDFSHLYDNLSIEPYLYLYFAFFLFVTPLRKIRLENLDLSNVAIGKIRFMSICNVCCFFEIIYMIVKLLQIVMVSTIGFGNFHDLGGDKADMILYSGGAVGMVMGIFNYIGRFLNISIMPYVICFSGYLFVTKSINRRKFLYMILPYCISVVLKGVVSGSRAGMFFALMEVGFYYVLFYRYFDHNLRRKINMLAIIFSSLLIFVTSQITVERFDDRNFTPFESIVRYLGEMWPNLGLEIWDKVNIHPNGEFLFSTFNGDDSQIQKWFYKTGVHTWWFYTIVGRLYFEYGKLLTIIIIISLGIMIRQYLSRKTFYLCHMGVVVFIFNFCVSNLFNLTIVNPIDLGSLLITLIIARYLRPRTKNIYSYVK